MAKLSTKKASATQRVMLFGAPKSGKSLIAGKLSEYYKILWVDLENGHETLFQLPEAWQDNIELISIPDTRIYPIAIETVLKMVKGPVSICEAHGKVNCMICKREHTKALKDLKVAEGEDEEAAKKELYAEYFVDTNLPALPSDYVVVFDSLTQLSNSAIAHITKNEADDYKLQFDDWGNLGKLLDIFLSQIQQAGYNVIVISHEVEAESEGSKKRTLVPVGGTRNFSRNIAKYFDHVVYCERKNKKHVFASSTSYATNILTGSRTDISMELLESDSLLPIFKPELYADALAKNKNVAITKPKPVGEAAADVLARLRTRTR